MRHTSAMIIVSALTLFLGYGHVVTGDGPTARKSFPLAGSGKAVIRGPSASPDGKRIVFGLKRLQKMEDRSTRLVMFNLKNGTSEFYDEPVGIGPEMWYGASWSPDSEKVAFTFFESESGRPSGLNTWLLHLGSARMERLLRLPPGNITQFPKIAPDGTRLLARDATTGNIVVVDMTTKTNSFLLKLSPNVSEAGVYRLGYDWAPDAKTVYVSTGYLNKAEPGIWSVDVRTGKRILLSDVYEPYVLSASPSGKYLAFVQRGEKRSSLYVARVQGFEVQWISDSAGLFLSWSRKGDRLAFYEWEEQRIGVWSPSEDTAVAFSVEKGKPSNPTWIGMTDSLAFVADETELWKLNVESGQQELLITASDLLKAQAASDK